MESQRDDRLNRPRSLVAATIAVCISALALLYELPPQSGIYPKCFFFALTGLLCPGCGGTRAIHAILHGELAVAFRLNPLVSVLFAPALAVTAIECYCIWRTGKFRAISLPPSTRTVAAVLIAAFWILRNAIPP